MSTAENAVKEAVSHTLTSRDFVCQSPIFRGRPHPLNPNKNWKDDAIITNKNVRIVSRVSETEKKKIESLADKCGLSISEYVRKRALGYEPKAVLPDVFFNFYEKLCELINSLNDNELKEKALNLFDEIHDEFFTEKKQTAKQIREEIQKWLPQDSGL